MIETAELFENLSMVCFVLAALCFVETVILGMLTNAKGAYQELKGSPGRSFHLSKRGKRKDALEKPARKINAGEEAMTVLDNGEPAPDNFLINVYEPGTEFLEYKEK